MFRMSHKTKVALVIAIFLWSSAFVGIRISLQGYSPEGLALLRYLIASVCMGIIYYRLPQRNSVNFRDVSALFVIGAIGIGIYNITLNYGELLISSGMASFITSQSPIITVIIAMIFLGERLNFSRVVGFIVSILGIALITVGEVGELKWDTSISYVLFATLAGSCYSILQKPFLKKYHAIEATTFVIWGGTLFLLIYFPYLQQDLVNASLKTTLTVIYLGIFPAAVGYMAWSYVLGEIPASQAVCFLYFMPFLATILGWVCLGEVPMGMSIAGGLLAIIGVWLVNQSYYEAQIKIPKKITLKTN
jgi:drug/metabolite transporter (DMT)-like permease